MKPITGSRDRANRRGEDRKNEYRRKIKGSGLQVGNG